MKKACALPIVLVGLVLLGLGVYATGRGLDAKELVREQLIAHDVTTPEGASIPNERVDDGATALSMARFIDGTVDQATGGRTFAEVGRYLTPSGSETGDPAAAALDSAGQPVVNPLRDTAFELSTASTSLYVSVMAYSIGDVAIGLGIVLLVLGVALSATGVALGGLAVPAFAKRLHLPHLRPHHA